MVSIGWISWSCATKLKVTCTFQLFHHKANFSAFLGPFTHLCACSIFLSCPFHTYSISHKCQANIIEIETPASIGRHKTAWSILSGWEGNLLEAGEGLLCILLNSQHYWPKDFCLLIRRWHSFCRMCLLLPPAPRSLRGWCLFKNSVGGLQLYLEVYSAWSVILLEWLSHQHHKPHRWLIIILIVHHVVCKTK